MVNTINYNHYIDKVFISDYSDGNDRFHKVVWVTNYTPVNTIHFRFFKTLYCGDWIYSNMIIYESTKDDRYSSAAAFVDNLIRFKYNIGTSNDLEEAEYIYGQHKYNIL